MKHVKRQALVTVPDGPVRTEQQARGPGTTLVLTSQLRKYAICRVGFVSNLPKVPASWQDL